MLNMTEYNHVLDAFTWHSYPLGAGKSPQVDAEIMNPLFRQKVAHTASEIQNADWNSLLPKGIWMGETGGAYNSGRNTVTNRFMSAFWYLDWLGTLSKVGFLMQMLSIFSLVPKIGGYRREFGYGLGRTSDTHVLQCPQIST